MSHPHRSAPGRPARAFRLPDGGLEDPRRKVTSGVTGKAKVAPRAPLSRPNMAWERPARVEASTQRLLEVLFATVLLALLFFVLQPAGLAMATYGAVGLTALGAPALVRRLRRLHVIERVRAL